MMNTSKIRQVELFIIATLWIIIFISPVLIFREYEYIKWNRVFASWQRLLPFLILFLINHFFLVPYLLLKKKKFLYFLAAFSMIVMLGFSSYIKHQRGSLPPVKREHRINPQGHPPIHRPRDNRERDRQKPPKPNKREAAIPFLNTLLLGVLVLGFDTGLKVFVQWSGVEREKMSLEKENMKNHLAFLRNQVSPHFFMNTLNNIHSLIDINTEEAKEAVIKLSKLMRYLLYESEGGMVPISKEVEFIQSFVSLMKLRFSNKVDIKVNIPIDLPQKSIPPILFISFIENAFKHGVSYQEPSFVYIKMEATKASLIFEMRNSIYRSIKNEDASGIGLENTKRRLDLLYGEKYHMTIEDENNEFVVSLTIPI